MVYAFPDRHCPSCGHIVTAYAPADRHDIEAPNPGDLSICLYCADLLVFGENLTLRVLEVSEVLTIAMRDYETYNQLLNYQKIVLQQVRDRQKRDSS